MGRIQMLLFVQISLSKIEITRRGRRIEKDVNCLFKISHKCTS